MRMDVRHQAPCASERAAVICRGGSERVRARVRVSVSVRVRACACYARVCIAVELRAPVRGHATYHTLNHMYVLEIKAPAHAMHARALANHK